MSETLFDAFEDCLSTMQQGKDIESCLARHPGLVKELRPLLAAAVEAQSLATPGAPTHVMLRGKTRLMNQAAELREEGYKGRKTAVAPFRPFRRAVRLTLASLVAVLMTFVAGGIGLVYASSSALPGDRLYPIKIGWEGAQLRLAYNSQAQQALQAQFEQERVDEVGHLIADGRAEDVHFVGTVTAIFPDRLVVSGIKVLMVERTKVEGNLVLNAMVRVSGITQPDGAVLASEIKVINPQTQNEEAEGTPDSGEPSGSGTQVGKPTSEEPPEESTPKPQQTPESKESFELEGKISNLGAGSMVVDGNVIQLTATTEIRGTLVKGIEVRVRGYIAPNGSLIATRVEVTNTEGGGDDGGRATATPSSGGGDGGTRTPTPTSGSGGGGDDDDSKTPTPTPTPTSGGGGG